MSRRRKPVIINLFRTQAGYAVDGLKKERSIAHNDVTSRHEEESSSVQDPFRANFTEGYPRHQSCSALHTTIPVTTQWFDPDLIHDIEKQALPEFFGGLGPSYKTPAEYLQYRNSIVAIWRENNKKYLNSSVCRKKIAGDSCAIIRIHGFLQDWGIINFPSKEYKGFLTKSDNRTECAVCSNKSTLFYITLEVGLPFQICKTCFDERIFPQALDISKFKLVDLQESSQSGDKSWTEDQTNKLLEMIERYRNNWHYIASEFPNRPVQKLILHYLRLPYLGISNFSIFQNGQDIKQPREVWSEPNIFEDYNNPLQLGIAAMYAKYRLDPDDGKQYEEVFAAAQKHSQYLALRQESKMKNIMRFVIDFQMNKLEGKSVCIQEYKKYVQSEEKNNLSIMKNHLATILRGIRFN